MLHALAEHVRQGRLDPVTLVEESLRRIEALDGPLNSVTDLCAEQALDAARQHNRQGPLAGLPVLVKDIVASRGMRNTFGGMPLLADVPIDTKDDPTVAALVRDGAIVVGRTNTPTFGAKGVTDNPLFGPTRNPWNLERTPCGSSGGAGAALAAGLAAICTSSDAGGSTRCPAAACGTVGYKPSAGLFVNIKGGRALGTSTVGAMGVTVADCLLEARSLVGRSPGNLFAPPPGSVSLSPRKPRRAVACASLSRLPEPHLLAAFGQACQRIEADLGIPVEWREQVLSRDYIALFARTFGVELRRALSPWREQWSTLEPSLQYLLSHEPDVRPEDVVDAYLSRVALAAEIDDLLGEDTVLLTLTHNIDMPGPRGERPNLPPGTDPGVGSLLLELEGGWNTLHFNISCHPALSVPIGVGPDGVPIGLQIVAPRWQDGLCFGLAQALEAAAPWPLAAPGYTPFSAAFNLR